MNKISLDHISDSNRIMAPTPWYGGKGNLVKQIVPHLPDGNLYCEPYCGMASVFWHKQPAKIEVLNDVYGLLVNFFRCMQDKASYEELYHRIVWTLYCREEFAKAIDVMADEEASDVDKAWAFYVGHTQGYSGQCNTSGDWGRAFVSNRGMAMTTNGWRGRMKRLEWWHDKLTRVQIDNVCALQCIEYWDSADTVFYVDPPYLESTRKSLGNYRHETDDKHHADLVNLLCEIDGQAVLSCYDDPMYAKLLSAGYQKIDIKTASYTGGKNRGQMARGAGNGLEHSARVETLYILNKTSVKQGLLFNDASIKSHKENDTSGA